MASRRFSRWVYVVILLAIAGSSLWLVACGSDDAVTTTSAPAGLASSTTSTVAGSSSSSSASSATSAPSTSVTTAPTTSQPVTTASTTPSTTAKPTVTTAKPTTTTAKPTTTTAKPTTTTAKPTTTTAKPTTTTAKAAVVLTVSGPGGTKELSMADLKGMSAVSGYGGWKNQLGNITAPLAWKGVSVNALLDLVGGGGSARVVASDGYEATLSGAELSGQMNVYDPATGEAISSFSGSLRVIVAYAKNGSGLGGEGPLRIAFVSPEKDQVTDSDQWVKNVVSIKAR